MRILIVKMLRLLPLGILVGGMGAITFVPLNTRCFAASIKDSKHNLSVSGPGTVKASAEEAICIFCHTPHMASGDAPLWNRFESGQIYVSPYSSSTVKASIDQPTGASKLCLSCHDGTVALGMVRSRAAEIPFAGGISVMPVGDTNLDIDLSDDHPISFVYDSSLVSQNPELNDPATLTGDVKLYNNEQVQCTSCHDPHDDTYGKFLVMDGINSGLCLQCHNKTGWTDTLHRTSSATWNNTPPDPWPHTPWITVAENSCENCHRPHGALGNERLLNYAIEETNCLVCHNGQVASININGEFNKSSVHPISDQVNAHDPTEAALAGSPRHVECADCHNPHAANDQDTTSLPGSLRLIKGIGSSGTEINPINNLYELCYRCHSDSPGSTPYINRQFPEMNTRLEYAVSNDSFHPIEGVGKNPDVPSLISPYTTASIITCIDCHNNNNGPNNNGNGPNGPHGSIYAPILERQLIMADLTEESLAAYAMCYKCHSQESIKRDESFDEHDKHVRGSDIPCTACHDPHGVKNVTHLINFDRDIVSPSSSGQLLFEDLGRFQGRCYLTCHGENHNPKTYGGN